WNFMNWVLALLIVLALAILYGFAVLMAGFAAKHYQAQCPACGRRALKQVTFIRATVVIDGKRCPDSWSYHRCEWCQAAFKKHQDTLLPVADPEIGPFESGNSKFC